MKEMKEMKELKTEDCFYCTGFTGIERVKEYPKYKQVTCPWCGYAGPVDKNEEAAVTKHNRMALRVRMGKLLIREEAIPKKNEEDSSE